MEPWRHRFRNFISDGDMCLDGKDYDGALSCYKQAFRLIPEPKNSFEESTIAIAAVGECYLRQEQYEEAEQALRDVLLCPGAPASVPIRLMRAQVYLALGDTKKSRMEVTVAYMNGGGEEVESVGVHPSIRPILDEVIRELA